LDEVPEGMKFLFKNEWKRVMEFSNKFIGFINKKNKAQKSKTNKPYEVRKQDLA